MKNVLRMNGGAIHSHTFFIFSRIRFFIFRIYYYLFFFIFLFVLFFTQSAEASGLRACRWRGCATVPPNPTPCASDLRPPRGGEPSPSPPCRPRLGGLLAGRRGSISPGDPPRTNKTAPWTHKIAPWKYKTAPWTHNTAPHPRHRP